LLVAVTVGLTTVYACITPFVAFGVIAAMTLSRGEGLGLALALWLANQAVGYGLLHYPWTANSVGWGLAIGAGAVLGTVAAQGIVARLGAARSPVRVLAAFGGAFAVYELGLYAAAVSLLGGTRGFALPIVGQVLLVNAAALVGLYGLNQLATAVGLLGRRAGGRSPARVA
jgi:hypothetical protein